MRSVQPFLRQVVSPHIASRLLSHSSGFDCLFAKGALALFDCLQSLALATVEVHISNIHAREEFRSKTVTGRAARGVITGLGFAGYLLAMEFLIDLDQ